MSMGMRTELTGWNSHANSMLAMAVEFPVEMTAFYAVMAEAGKKIVQDELMERVYSTPLPAGSSWGAEPSPRTGKTLRSVKSSSSAFRSSVFLDRRLFSYFYPWILEHGRAGTSYYGRGFFRAAMHKLEIVYYRQAHVLLRNALRSRGI